MEVGDIFKIIEEIKALITDLHMRKDMEGALFDEKLADLHASLYLHHSLL